MRIPAVYMRGGTSKAMFFHEADLPPAGDARDRFILAAYGSPDPYERQLDGVGGATSSTSKVAIISRSDRPEVDVDYEFGQVGIGGGGIDRRGNCGNISSAVGPFAVDEGLVPATDPVTTVRFRNTNTDKVIVAHVPTRGGRFDPTGDFELSGIPGTGSKIVVDYLRPAGAVTGKLLPTSSVVDRIEMPSGEALDASLVDAANPFVFVRAGDVGLAGRDALATLRDDADTHRLLEDVRVRAAVLMGMAATPQEAHDLSSAFPKIAVVFPHGPYVSTTGRSIDPGSYTVRAAMMSMGKLHASYPLTGAIATAVAARLPGTLVHEAASAGGGSAGGELAGGELAGRERAGRERAGGENVVIGHPAGLFPLAAEVHAEAETGSDDWDVARVSCFRTARRLMEGHLLTAD